MNDSWLDDPSLYVKPKAGATPDFDDPALYKPSPRPASDFLGDAPKREVGPLESLKRSIPYSLYGTEKFLRTIAAMPAATAYDAIHGLVSGKNEDGATNAAGRWIDAAADAQNRYGIQPGETQTIGSKIAGALGGAAPDLAMMALTGGGSAEGQLATQLVDHSAPVLQTVATKVIPKMLEHSARASVVPGLRVGAEQAEAKGDSTILTALNDVLGGYAHTTAINAVPLAGQTRIGAALPERIVTRGAQGAVSMPVVNATANSLTGGPVTGEQAIIDAVTGALFSQAGNDPHRPMDLRAPESAAARAPEANAALADRMASALATENRRAQVAPESAPTVPPEVITPAIRPEPQPQSATSALDALLTRNVIDSEGRPPASMLAPNIPWEAAAAALGLAPPKPAHADPFLDAARLAAQGLKPDGSLIDAKPAEQMASLDVRPKGQEQFNAPEPETAPTPSKASPARVQPSTDVTKVRGALNVQMGNREFPVSSIEDASAKFLQMRDQLGDIGGMSVVRLIDQQGHPVGYIGHNGEVYEGLVTPTRDSRGRATTPKPIYDPRTPNRYGADVLDGESSTPQSTPRKSIESEAVSGDLVGDRLQRMANGEHPEQALEGADIETVREVAKAMGLKPTAKSRQGAMVERIGEMARADWIKAAKAAVETRGVPKATEPAPVRTRRQAKAEPSAKKPIDLLEAIARSGGLNRDAFRAYGIDPAEFTRRAGFHYVFRKNGGMRPDDLREWMQQEGYLPADHPDRPASVDANDAFDLFDRAFRSGERIYADGQEGDVARYDEQRRADMAGPDEHDAIDHALAGELGYPDAGAMHDAFANERARQEDRANDIVPEGYNEARSLGELFADPAVRAMSEDEIGRILQLPEADQARALWKAIDERQEATGHFTATDDRGYPRGNERSGAAGSRAVREEPAPFQLGQRDVAGRTPEEVRRATERQGERSGSLFGEPTTRDRVDAAQRAKDAERDGKTGTGRTDMAAGDGELFAGDRPGQGRIESSRDMFASYPKDGETNGRERQDQTGNGRSDLDSGRASAGGGDAGGVGLRADATPSLTQRGKYAVESLVRRFGGSILADKLNRSFRETDTARLIGQKISADPAKAAHDLAAISEVYRNPIFETLRYIFADKDGNILGETAVESRMPSSSAAFPTGEDGVDFIIRNAPDGATHLWLQHNHPSGNPTPSPADVYLTRGLALKLREAGAGIEIAGHVVLNHKTYAFIPHDADPRTFNRDYSVNPIDRPDVNDPLIADRGLSGQRIGNDADAARIGANYLRQIKKDSFVLISTDAKGAVALVSAFPLRALGNPKALGLAAQLGKRSGAYRQFVVMHDTNIPADIRQQVVKALDAGMRSGAIADVVSADGTQHPVIKHSRIVNSGNHIETLLGRNGRGDRAVKVYEEDSGYRMTPEQESFMRKAGLHGAQDTRTLPERAKDWLSGKLPESWKDHLIQGGFDQYYGLRKASEKAGLSPEESPYYAARLINNASTMEAVLRFGAPKLVDGTLRVDRGVKGLMDALEPVKDSMPQFLGWMVARRAQLLKQQGREHLMTDADIRAGLSLRQGHEQAFDQAALDYLKLKNAVLDLAEKTGVIDPVARAAWDHAEYIPFYREGDTGGTGTRRGIANQSSGIRTLKGGEAAIRDPLSNIVQNFTRLVDASMKNRAATLAVDKLAGDLFEKVPMAVDQAMIPLDQVKKHLLSTGVDQATIDGMPASALKGIAKMLSIKPLEGEDVIRIMRGGKAEYYRVKDPFLLTALTAMHETPTPMFVKMLAYPKHLLTAGATATPDFMIANMLRDTGEAAVTSKDNFIPVWDTLRGAVDAFRHNELAQDLMMAGASFHGGYFRTGDAEATSSAIRKALARGGHDRPFIDKYVKTLANPARLKEVYFDIMGATEQGSRLSTARRRLNAGGSFADAAFEAKDLLDFQLRGAASSVRFFTQVIPFLNARMQGAYRLGRIGTTKGRRNAVAARLAVMALASTALYAMNIQMFGQAYDDLEDWDKDANWHIAPGTKYHLRIPKPFELGLVGGTLPERMYGAIRYQLGKEENADRPEQSVDSMIRAITGTLELNPIPQAAKPVVEEWGNRNMYFNRPIESQGDKFKSPKDRYGNNTSDTMRAASSAMQSVVGSDYTLSPKRMEHLWRGYTGGMGMYALHAADVVTRKVEGAPERPDMLLRDLPLTGRFLRGGGEAPSTRFQGEFYDLKDKADAKAAEIKGLIQHGDTERADELQRKWSWLLGDKVDSPRAKAGFMFDGSREINQIEKKLAALRKSDAEIYADPEMSGAEKRQKLNENAAERNAITRDAVKEMRRRQRAASSQ